ncbi:dioxygenase [Paraburkholderia terrae]|uniref:dioxygenase family protein n=1 Tax=Paraburkholderia terrae TaxID=311230 RepID=UPI00206F11EA|nr:dioxygenase [Paraburkholderia terrae]BDC40233.1 6-chlorohydroxyquinol-1,2-dioxygenase [Paraburkholderia terrae]
MNSQTQPERQAVTRDLDEFSVTDAVVARMANARSARTKRVLAALIRHLHEFAREVELTEAEWEYGIDFLTRAGHMSTPERQEVILLSDTLGFSTLVTQMNHRSHNGESEQTVLGPFHRAGNIRYEHGANISEGIDGPPCFVNVTVRAPDGAPIRDATVDVWHSDHEGYYDVAHEEWDGDMRMRGIFTPDATGAVRFRTIVPASYPVPQDGPVGELLRATARHPMRPAHVHFKIDAPGFDPLVTHLFVNGDPYLDSDAVFGVRNALIADFVRHAPGDAPDGSVCETEFFTLDYDFVLRHVSPV